MNPLLDNQAYKAFMLVAGEKHGFMTPEEIVVTKGLLVDKFGQGTDAVVLGINLGLAMAFAYGVREPLTMREIEGTMDAWLEELRTDAKEAMAAARIAWRVVGEEKK